MPSVIAPLLDAEDVDLAAGAVLPIDRYISEARALVKLVMGGSLFLVTTDAARRTWLVAILEAPEFVHSRVGARVPGCYAPVNATPITEIKALRIARDLVEATPLTAAQEAKLRKLVDEDDAIAAPVITSTRGESEPRVVVDPAAPPLARAAAHLANAQVVPAIDAMIEAWRDARDPALAELIDRATRVLPAYDRPLLATRYGDRKSDRTWRAALGDPAALPQVLQNATLAYDQRLGPLCTRLPGDPRVAEWLAAQVARTHPDARDQWRVVADYLLATRDERAKGALCAIEAAMKAYEGGYLQPAAKLAKLFEFAHTRAAKMPAIDHAPIERALEVLEAPRRTELSLVDAIAEHPDDPEPYAVYADWLQERQHPRGEYLALVAQRAAGELSAAQNRRLGAFDDVPFLFGALDELAVSHLRPRPRGIDRTLVVSWAPNAVAWKRLAVQPLSRALARIEMLGDERFARPDGLIAFANASPRLDEIVGVPAKLHAAVIAGTANRFAVRAKSSVLKRRRL